MKKVRRHKVKKILLAFFLCIAVALLMYSHVRDETRTESDQLELLASAASGAATTTRGAIPV